MAYSYDDRDREFRQSPPPRPPRKEDNDLGSWILIIFLFIVAWPAGLAVLLSKVLGNDSRRKNAARSTRSTVSRSDPAVSRANPNPSQARPGTASAAGRKVTKTPQYSAKAARNMKIVGLVLLFAGLVSLVEGIGAATGGLSWALLASLFPTMGLAAGGLGLLLAGGVMTRRARRFGKYLACAHGQEAVSLKKLAVAADVSPRKVENDLEIMIEKGLWGENAYLDLGSDMLFRSPEAADAFFGKKKQEQEVQEPPQAEQGYSGVLRDIRRANDRIADPVLSQKIDRLEEVAGKIFRIIEKEPAKKAKASWMSCTGPTPWTSTATSGSWRPCSAGTAPPWPTISAWAAARRCSRRKNKDGNKEEKPHEACFCPDFSPVHGLRPVCLREETDGGGPRRR